MSQAPESPPLRWLAMDGDVTHSRIWMRPKRELLCWPKRKPIKKPALTSASSDQASSTLKTASVVSAKANHRRRCVPETWLASTRQDGLKRWGNLALLVFRSTWDSPRPWGSTSRSSFDICRRLRISEASEHLPASHYKFQPTFDTDTMRLTLMGLVGTPVGSRSMHGWS